MFGIKNSSVVIYIGEWVYTRYIHVHYHHDHHRSRSRPRPISLSLSHLITGVSLTPPHLAAGVNSLGEEGVGVSVVKRVLGRERGSGIVAVAVVGGAGDLGQVGGLVEGGGLLVLGVAGLGGRGQVAEEDGAVDDVVLRGQGVGEDAVAAALVHVGAVVGRAARRAGRLLRHLVEHVDDLVAHRRVVEVLGQLVVVAAGGVGGRLGERRRALDGVDRRRQLVARAVVLDGLALAVEGLEDRGGLEPVHVDGGQDVAAVGDGADDLGGAGLGVLQSALGDDLVDAAEAQVMELSSVEDGGDGLAGADGLEAGLGQVAGGHAETDTGEVDLVLCEIVSWLGTCHG